MASVAPQPKSIARLRYRFGSTDQMRKHFHQQEGRVLVFFPGVQLVEGNALVLDVSFTGSEQTCALRGRVLGNDQGQASGSWLEFSLHGLVAGLAEATRSPRRRHRRLPSEQLLALMQETGPELCRLTDLGLGGGRIQGFQSRLAPGAEARLALFGQASQRPLDLAKVIWARTGDMGVRFLRADGAARAAVTRLVESVQAEWKGAPEVTHPALCPCDHGGALLEPALPRAGFRKSSDGTRSG